jgi:hypothetical protein
MNYLFLPYRYRIVMIALTAYCLPLTAYFLLLTSYLLPLTSYLLPLTPYPYCLPRTANF